MRFTPTTFRPALGRALCVMTVTIVAIGLAGFVVAGDLVGLVRYGWGLALTAVAAIALYWLPSLRVAEQEVTVRNIFSTVHVPWSAIQRVDTKWALTIYTPNEKIAVWASPAPGRYSSGVSGTSETRLAASVLGSNPRPGDLLETASGAAAFVIRSHADDLREGGLPNSAEAFNRPLRRDIHWATIAAVVVLAVATVLGIVL